jgi:peptidyl-prolyl cis-trans isomerase A (cyclophilin A)
MKTLAALALSVLFGTQEETARRVVELIEKLKSDTIEEREEAARKLREIGKPAVAELKKAAQLPDTEVAGRAKSILESIAADENPLLDPKAAAVNKEAPAEFKVKVATSQGDFVIKVTRDWAPLGADRFYNLARNGFYDDCRFFRVIAGFMAQFGIHGDPAISAKWKAARIKDDPVKEGNKRGRVSFAMAGPNSRTTQLFINFKDNDWLDGSGFAAFGEVTEGMDVVDKLYSGYGEGEPTGKGPSQPRIQAEGTKYLEEFKRLDILKSARILEP